jgi:hypothetical protein
MTPTTGRLGSTSSVGGAGCGESGPAGETAVGVAGNNQTQKCNRLRAKNYERKKHNDLQLPSHAPWEVESHLADWSQLLVLLPG